MESAEFLLKESISCTDLQQFEKKYLSQLSRGAVDDEVKVQYAWCLIRSKYPIDVKKGIALLEELNNRANEETKRDYLFYLAIGNAKLREYALALKYTKQLLKDEPNNLQVKSLQKVIEKRMQKEGFLGMAYAGGAAVVLGALVGLAISIAKK